MRLFVALSISDEVHERLASFLNELRRADSKARWVKPDNLHVTLKFIGHVADEQLPTIIAALQRVAASSAIALEFRGIGFFPNDHRPTVIWAGIQAPLELAALATQVNEAVTPCGVARETRPFAPHLTLARLKEPRLSEPLRTLIASSKDRVFGEQVANEFHLMESKTKPTGAEYTTLRSFPFAAEEKHR
jgi:2'-5' RNA ligase